jgi:16S rRNA G966 N2-methylase RsmD/DNA-directed RNA polymerase subunit RPC12/RpoP
MYVWHKYWARKTWNVVGEFIQHYTREQEVVFDPFAGSGVVAIEAARRGRRSIVIDLNPAASLITELTLRQVNLVALQEAFGRIEEQVRGKIEKLYEVHCLKCGHLLVAPSFVREGDEVTEVRYPKCPTCGHRCEAGCAPKEDDQSTLKALERKPIQEWYPKQRLYYSDGTAFMKKEHYDTLDQLFTKRNLRAAAILHQAIQSERSPLLRKFLMGAFTSMIHLCTRMMPVGNPTPTVHYTYFSSPGWTQHSYWSAPRFMEQNVWDRFQGAVNGHQGLVNAQNERAKLLPKIKLTDDWQEVLCGKADIAVITDDCLRVMTKMPEDCVDYIFTDPPYDASVQYGELSYLWNAWLKKNGRYTERLVTHEIVRNERQNKPFEVYYSLLSNAFNQMYRVLRRGRHLTLTFHNPTFKVRNATVRAGVYAGFDYQKIHHQPLGQVSAKAMLQPFGSAQGDFYLRFEKPAARGPKLMEEVTEERFRRIVVEKCREVIAERAEPTPYTILLNQVDPELAKMGLFGTLRTGMDVKSALQDEVGKTFRLVRAKMGGAEGRLWWFNDPTFEARLKQVPLTERVEQTVYRVLHERGRVTFTQVWDAVSQEFPNSLTSDSTSIREALEMYARKTGKGYWMMRTEVEQRLRSHPEIIGLLAVIGRSRGYDIWVGRNEQGHDMDGLAPPGKLSALVTARPSKLDGVTNLETALDMDLLWLDGNSVVMAFEVEATTTLTSALLRGSNLPAKTPKVIVLPEEREDDLRRKMQSPLFKERYERDTWTILYFDALRNEFSKAKDKTRIEDLFATKRSSPTTRRNPDANRAGSDQGLLALEYD